MKNKKILRISAIAIAAASLFAFAACNNNDNDSEQSRQTSVASEPPKESEPADPLVGKWQAETLPEYVYTFNADGSGQYDMAGTILEMNYSTENGKITMNYTTEGYSSVTLDYVFEGDRLNIKDSFGKDTFYLKVKE